MVVVVIRGGGECEGGLVVEMGVIVKVAMAVGGRDGGDGDRDCGVVLVVVDQ